MNFRNVVRFALPVVLVLGVTPSSSQNDKLLPFAGKKVTVSGKVFQRGGSTAIVISKIEPQVEAKN